MNNLFFSIIIPVYNRVEFITLAIESCLKQSFEHFELIVIDDGSTDGTAEAVKRIKDERVNYVYQENSERGAARNHGVKLAKGKYVFFLDSDDLLDRNHLELAKKKIDSIVGLDFLFTGIKSNVNADFISLNPDFGDLIDPQIILKRNVCGSVIFLRREFAIENKFEEDRRLAGSEDRLLVLELSKKTKLHNSNNNTYSLIDHPDRSMLSIDATLWSGQLEILTEKIKNNGAISSKEIKIVRSSFLQMVAIKLFIGGKSLLGFQWYWNSLQERPEALISGNTLRVIRYGLFGSIKKPLKIFLMAFLGLYLVVNAVHFKSILQPERDYDKAIFGLDKFNPEESVNQIVGLVSTNFKFEYRPYKFYENPISVLVNLFHSGVSQVSDSRFLFEHSDKAFCGQQSKLIADFSKELGYDYRYVIYRNHVAIEIFYDNNWHYFDPTNTVFVKKDSNEVENQSFFELYTRNKLEVKKGSEKDLGDLSNTKILDKNVNFYSKLEMFNLLCLWIWYVSAPLLSIIYFSRNYWKGMLIQQFVH